MFVQINPNGTTGTGPPIWLYFCGALSFHLGRFPTCDTQIIFSSSMHLESLPETSILTVHERCKAHSFQNETLQSNISESPEATMFSLRTLSGEERIRLLLKLLDTRGTRADVCCPVLPGLTQKGLSGFRT